MVDRLVVFLLAVLFLFSGIDKILHFDGFLDALRNYVLLPRWAAGYVGPPVIVTELLVGAGLLFKAWRRPAALTAAVAMFFFTLAVAGNYFAGSRGICGCWFTLTLSQSTELHILQNLVWGGLAAMVWWEEGQAPPAAAPSEPPPGEPAADSPA
jgi:uncharacterized membrane protein YphA (DoxX/SURF4 family)